MHSKSVVKSCILELDGSKSAREADCLRAANRPCNIVNLLPGCLHKLFVGAELVLCHLQAQDVVCVTHRNQNHDDAGGCQYDR